MKLAKRSFPQEHGAGAGMMATEESGCHSGRSHEGRDGGDCHSGTSAGSDLSTCITATGGAGGEAVCSENGDTGGFVGRADPGAAAGAGGGGACYSSNAASDVERLLDAPGTEAAVIRNYFMILSKKRQLQMKEALDGVDLSSHGARADEESQHIFDGPVASRSRPTSPEASAAAPGAVASVARYTAAGRDANLEALEVANEEVRRELERVRLERHAAEVDLHRARTMLGQMEDRHKALEQELKRVTGRRMPAAPPPPPKPQVGGYSTLARYELAARLRDCDSAPSEADRANAGRNEDRTARSTGGPGASDGRPKGVVGGAGADGQGGGARKQAAASSWFLCCNVERASAGKAETLPPAARALPGAGAADGGAAGGGS